MCPWRSRTFKLHKLTDVAETKKGQRFPEFSVVLASRLSMFIPVVKRSLWCESTYRVDMTFQTHLITLVMFVQMGRCAFPPALFFLRKAAAIMSIKIQNITCKFATHVHLIQYVQFPKTSSFVIVPIIQFHLHHITKWSHHSYNIYMYVSLS